jgi:hypothetical protein
MSEAPVELTGEITLEEAARLLQGWGHPRAARWLELKVAGGAIPYEGDPPRVAGADVWRELLRDECDKLYNQAWCALDQIRDAEDEESVLMLAMDDLPSSVEQAFSLDPTLAREHVDLLKEHRFERYRQFVDELAVGTDRETRERIECLGFWEENGTDLSDLRRTLFRLVRETLESATRR